VPTFLVEFYAAAGAGGLVDAAERARAGAEAVAGEGVPVRYLLSIFVPEDETCLLLFEGSSGDAVRMAAERAGIRITRIVEALHVESAEPGPEKPVSMRPGGGDR
jgi:hypothetical protein